MRAQLKRMGLSLDWSREFATCDPEYYHQQQRLFLDLLQAGLVYRKKSKVNWDPVDQTVLANEQVIDGRGWRSGALVEQRELTQWFFKITALRRRPARRLDTLDRWPDKVRAHAAELDRQESEGLLVRFDLSSESCRTDSARSRSSPRARIRFSARASSRISPEHPLAQALARTIRNCATSSPSAAASAPRRRRSTRAEKKGYDTGLRRAHPFDPTTKLPVYVANFILMEYGTGAIFGCPAHDQRDLDFARKYGLTVYGCRHVRKAQIRGDFKSGTRPIPAPGKLANSSFLTA